MLKQTRLKFSSPRHGVVYYARKALYSLFMSVLVLSASALLFALVMQLSAPAARGAQDDSALSVIERAVIVEEVLLLSHVFRGLPPSRDRLIGRAPRAGKSMLLDARTVKALARRHGLEWSPPPQFKGVLIVRSAKLLSHERVSKALADYLVEFFPRLAPFEIIPDQHDWSLALPSTGGGAIGGTSTGSGNAVEAGLQGRVALNFTDAKIDPARRRFAVRLAENHSATHGFSGARVFSGRVDPLIEVPVLARAVARGRLIRRSDLELQRMAARHVDERVVVSRSALVGKEARRNLQAGLMLKENDVQKPWMVRRRDLVTIRYRHGHVVLTATARALEDGKMGDVIRLKNEQSGRVIEAEISGAQNARIPHAESDFLAQARP